MKYIAAFSLVLVLAAACFGDDVFIDLPAGHYASQAVYDLADRNVTAGFPDGTFRGEEFISRYEIASFLSKLAASINKDRGRDEKVLKEFNSELSTVRYESEKNKEDLFFAGDFYGVFKRGKTPLLSGSEAGYRFQGVFAKVPYENMSVKIGLDTLDSGLGGPNRDFVREMLSVEGKIKVGAMQIIAFEGPGDITHRDAGLFPDEDGIIYRKFKRRLTATVSGDEKELAASYIVRSAAPTGVLSTTEINAEIAIKPAFGKIFISPRLFSDQTGARTFFYDLALNYAPFGISMHTSINSDSEFPHNLYASIGYKLGDSLELFAKKIGSRYRNKFSYAIYDIFDRAIADGQTNLGIKLKSRFNAEWGGEILSCYTLLPDPIITSKIGIEKYFAENVSLGLKYTNYQAGFTAEKYELGLNCIL
ncbi:MAG: S-layer homology domain-containing protein [Candidatus Margulisiibacteriota bacterium]